MVYAQIKNNRVINTIILNNEELLPIFKQNIDDCIRIDEISPRPGIDWNYDGGEFSPPNNELEQIEE